MVISIKHTIRFPAPPPTPLTLWATVLYGFMLVQPLVTFLRAQHSRAINTGVSLLQPYLVWYDQQLMKAKVSKHLIGVPPPRFASFVVSWYPLNVTVTAFRKSYRVSLKWKQTVQFMEALWDNIRDGRHTAHNPHSHLICSHPEHYPAWISIILQHQL